MMMYESIGPRPRPRQIARNRLRHAKKQIAALRKNIAYYREDQQRERARAEETGERFIDLREYDIRNAETSLSALESELAEAQAAWDASDPDEDVLYEIDALIAVEQEFRQSERYHAQLFGVLVRRLLAEGREQEAAALVHRIPTGSRVKKALTGLVLTGEKNKDYIDLFETEGKDALSPEARVFMDDPNNDEIVEAVNAVQMIIQFIWWKVMTKDTENV